jgi:hypothetical protein
MGAAASTPAVQGAAFTEANTAKQIQHRGDDGRAVGRDVRRGGGRVLRRQLQAGKLSTAVKLAAKLEARRLAAARMQLAADEAVSATRGASVEVVDKAEEQAEAGSGMGGMGDRCGAAVQKYEDIAAELKFTYDDIVAELNFARMKPKTWAKRLERRLAGFDGNKCLLEGRPRPFMTAEGPAAVTETINFCKKQKPLTTKLTINSTIGLSAMDHALVLGNVDCKKILGHTGSDESNMQERVARYGSYTSSGECVWTGPPYSTAQELIEDLIIDDGVKDRSHRICIYADIFDAVGMGLVKVPNLMHLIPDAPDVPRGLCVLNFSKNFCRNETRASAREAAGVWAPDWMGDVEFIWNGCARKKIAKTGTCAGCKQDIRGGKCLK